MEWKYQSKTLKSTGYEDHMDYLKRYPNREEFKALPTEEQKAIIEDYRAFYREKDIFPIPYFNEDGVIKEIKRCIDYNAYIKDGNILNCGAGVGTAMCNYLFPNLFETVSLHNPKEGKNMIEKFNNDKCLSTAIGFALRSCSGGATPTNVYAGMRMHGAMPSNFRPMNAKALYEKYVPENGIIYDFASGFGGRMLGALTSKNNYRYIGVDPCTDTYNNLIKLGNLIEQVTGRTNSFRVYKECSENFCPQTECVDFAFSSPPYFNLEQYSAEETQSYNKYNNLDLWFEYYVRPTINNIHTMLKDGCYYAVNIADFKTSKEGEVKFVDRWLEISKECGFEFIEQLTLKIPARTKSGEGRKTRPNDKREGIFVFKKVSSK